MRSNSRLLFTVVGVLDCLWDFNSILNPTSFSLVLQEALLVEWRHVQLVVDTSTYRQRALQVLHVVLVKVHGVGLDAELAAHTYHS